MNKKEIKTTMVPLVNHIENLNISGAFQYYRVKRAITFLNLQRLSKVSDTMIKDIESGKKVNPTLNTLLSLFSALNVSAKDFFEMATILVDEKQQEKYGVLKNGGYAITVAGIKNTCDFLEYKRNCLRMNHEEYAKFLNISETTIRTMRTGTGSLSMFILAKISRAHGVTMPSILKFNKESFK